MTPSLELTGICKAFGGTLVLNDAYFSAYPGEIHALLGENGAGKSSLMNVAAGFYAAEAGAIFLDGQPTTFAGPKDAKLAGIGMIHQHFKLVKNFTVLENVLLANPRGSFRHGGRVIRQEIEGLASKLGFPIDLDRKIDALSIADQQRVEILKALISGARILILDEPTAVLTEEEAFQLLNTLTEIAATGTTVVLVTHKLKDVKLFASRVTIMRNGCTVATVDPKTKSVDELTMLTVGTAAEIPQKAARRLGGTRLVVTRLCCGGREARRSLDDISFSVKAGEIYGIAGVGGNGQAELVDVLSGARFPDSGHIEIAGDDAGTGFAVTMASPGERLRHGFAVIPADRQGEALASSLSIADNYAIGRIHEGDYGSWLYVRRKAIRQKADQAIRNSDVQGVRRLSQRAATLSGGNAQKLVVGREFDRSPSILIVHSPSRGLDAKASATVQRRLVEATERGVAIILISEDLDEVLGLSDRIGVMAAGRIVAEFSSPADRHEVGKAMVNHA